MGGGDATSGPRAPPRRGSSTPRLWQTRRLEASAVDGPRTSAIPGVLDGCRESGCDNLSHPLRRYAGRYRAKRGVASAWASILPHEQDRTYTPGTHVAFTWRTSPSYPFGSGTAERFFCVYLLSCGVLGFVRYVPYTAPMAPTSFMRAWTPIALILSAAAGAPLLAAERGPVKSLLEMRRDRVVVQKWDLSCGAAALATLLNYQHGDPVPEREIAKALIQRKEYLANPLRVRVQQGFSLLDLKRYVDKRGYEGIGYGRLTLQDLIEQAPILVPLSLHGYNHFVVFRGRRGDRVLIADPAWGNRTLRVERFEEAWIDSPEIGKVGFVVVRREGSTPPNRLAPRASDFVMLR